MAVALDHSWTGDQVFYDVTHYSCFAESSSNQHDERQVPKTQIRLKTHQYALPVQDDVAPLPKEISAP
jgi:hypothetical protein